MMNKNEKLEAELKALRVEFEAFKKKTEFELSQFDTHRLNESIHKFDTRGNLFPYPVEGRKFFDDDK